MRKWIVPAVLVLAAITVIGNAMVRMGDHDRQEEASQRALASEPKASELTQSAQPKYTE